MAQPHSVLGPCLDSTRKGAGQESTERVIAIKQSSWGKTELARIKKEMKDGKISHFLECFFCSRKILSLTKSKAQ